ncbi:MAG: alkaline exonuclease [Namikivirus tsukuho]|uniref:Alkaline exonuclease n=1 Tax=Bacteriophage sp. TaxID=38018 RepID=A0ABY5TSS8_9VIRU|nr:MAG: alkaline exonuclease [Bacteriophage sp.]
MKIINLSQSNDTDAWLQERIGRITGTKSGSLALDHYQQTDTKKIIKYRDKALKQSKEATTRDETEEHYRTALKYDELLSKTEAKNKRLKVGIDFWKFLAETMAEQPDGENPMERGHRLEPENIRLTLQQLGYEEKDCITDCGIWESDEDPRVACSPDAYQNSENPTWAIECKSLGSAYHLQAVIPWMVHSQRIRQREIPGNLADAAAQVLPATATSLKATNMDFIPDAYEAQVLQYFVVCDTLETLYFSMYDPRVYGDARHQIVPINRGSIQPLIAEHKRKQLNTLHIIDTLTEATGASF